MVSQSEVRRVLNRFSRLSESTLRKYIYDLLHALDINDLRILLRSDYVSNEMKEHIMSIIMMKLEEEQRLLQDAMDLAGL